MEEYKYIIVEEDVKYAEQLNKLLYSAGIERKDCYVIQIRNNPTSDKDFSLCDAYGREKVFAEKFLSNGEELLACIGEIKPKVVIAMGDRALTLCTGHRSIENWRGSLVQVGNITCVPTFGARSVVRGGGRSHWYLPAIIHDLKKARGVVGGEVKVADVDVEIVRTEKRLNALFVRCVGKLCAFDIETPRVGMEEIKCIGFSHNGTEAFVVPFQEGACENAVGMLSVIIRWMTSGAIRWVGQNAYNFDIPYIHRVWGFRVKNFTLDTLVAHQILHPELPHSLAVLASFYTNIPYWKHLGETDLLRYNGLDAGATLLVARGEIQELQSRRLYTQYESYQHRLLAPLMYMYEEGIQVDMVYKGVFTKKLKQQIKEGQQALDDYYIGYVNVGGLKRKQSRAERLIKAGRKNLRLPKKEGGKSRRRKSLVTIVKRCKAEIKKKESLNVRSKLQLSKFLYITLKLPKRMKKGKVTTDESALIKLFLKTKHEFLKRILYLRRVRNKYSRYGRMKVDQQGRVRTTYKFVETGRLSSGKYEAK